MNWQIILKKALKKFTQKQNLIQTVLVFTISRLKTKELEKFSMNFWKGSGIKKIWVMIHDTLQKIHVKISNVIGTPSKYVIEVRKSTAEGPMNLIQELSKFKNKVQGSLSKTAARTLTQAIKKHPPSPTLRKTGVGGGARLWRSTEQSINIWVVIQEGYL